MLNYELYIGAIDLSPYIAEKRNTSIWLVDVPAETMAALRLYFPMRRSALQIAPHVCIVDRTCLISQVVASTPPNNYEHDCHGFSENFRLSMIDLNSWVNYYLKFFTPEGYKHWNAFGDVLEKRLHV